MALQKLKNKTILVFTGGGLAPALNPTLFGVISAAQKQDMKVLGGLYGWACLTPRGKVIDLTDFDATPLKNVGGTFLRSSRTNPFKVEGGLDAILDAIKEELKKKDINYIVAIGGDDTLGAAQKLFNQAGVKIIGVPKTIDNDLQATYWTPGYPSAAYYAAKYCYEIKVDAAYALSRIYIIEVLGRQSGWLAAAGAFGQADVIIPPERECKLDNLLQVISERYKANGNFATVVASEEAKFDRDIVGIDQEADKADSYKIKRKSFIGLGLYRTIINELGITGKPLFPGNFMQTGKPIGIDGRIGVAVGEKAIQLISEDKYGYMPSVERKSSKLLDITVGEASLEEAVGKVRLLDESYFDFANFQVKQKYFDYAEPFMGKADAMVDPYYKIIKDIR